MSKKILVTSVAAALVALILGYLVYGMALKNFFSGEMTQANIERPPEEMVWWAMIVGHLAWGYFLTYVIGHWAGISTFGSGAKAGALIGFLVGLTFNMINYAVMDISSVTVALADPIVMAVIAGITGGFIGWMMGMKKE